MDNLGRNEGNGTPTLSEVHPKACCLRDFVLLECVEAKLELRKFQGVHYRLCSFFVRKEAPSQAFKDSKERRSICWVQMKPLCKDACLI